MCLRQPGMQRQQAGLGPEAHESQQKNSGSRAGRNTIRVRGDDAEGVAAAGRGQEHQGCQDGREAQLGHDRVGDSRRPDGVTAMLGQHQDQRRGGHQLPGQQERRDRSGCRDKEQGCDEKRKHEQGETSPVFPLGVPDGVDAHGDRDRTGGGEEEPAKRIQIETDTDQGQQPTDLRLPRRAEDDAEPKGHAGGSKDSGQAAGQPGDASGGWAGSVGFFDIGGGNGGTRPFVNGRGHQPFTGRSPCGAPR